MKEEGMKETLVGKVRGAMRMLGPSGTIVTLPELAQVMRISDKADRSKMRYALKDLCSYGEVERIGPAQYVYWGKQKEDPKALVMWRALRVRGKVTVEDLAELSGGTERGARTWLDKLVKNGMVRQKNGEYRLIHDPVVMPGGTRKDVALARALQALDRAAAAITDARDLVRRKGGFE